MQQWRYTLLHYAVLLCIHNVSYILGENGSTTYQAEFAIPTRELPVPPVSCSVYISGLDKKTNSLWVRFEQQEYQWKVERDETGQWRGMERVNPMKWMTEIIRSKQNLPFNLIEA